MPTEKMKEVGEPLQLINNKRADPREMFFQVGIGCTLAL